MSKIDDGGPAFPIPLNPGSSWNGMAPCDGMALRDYMAAKALPAIYSCAMKEAAEGSGLLEHPDWPIGLARDAYRMADAMLRARGAKA